MKAICIEENCDRHVVSRERCKPHYEKWRKVNRDKVDTSKSSKWYNEDGTRMTCVVGDCELEVETQGMCLRHYRIFYYESNKGSRVSKKNRKRRDFEGNRLDLRCTFPGCELPEFNPGLCAGHYYQGRRGEELRPLREKAPCPFPGCEKFYSVKLGRRKLCRDHSDTCYRFSLSTEQLLDLFRDGVCSNPGCDNTANLHIDHDHRCCHNLPGRKVSCGKCVRSVLCSGCNASLGLLKENPRRIEGLLEYLESFKK